MAKALNTLWAPMILILLLVATLALGEKAAVQPQSGAIEESSYEREIRKGKREMVRGNVLSTEDYQLPGEKEPGLGLKVSTEKGDMFVHLGPRWFLTRHEMAFNRGEAVGIVGVTIRFEDKPALVAHEVSLDSKKVQLRDPASQKPLWSPRGPEQ